MDSPDYAQLRAENYQLEMDRLRRRAEKRRQELPPIPKSPVQVRKLLEELQIQQIELELQYEEAIAMQAETEAMRARFTDLFDFAPVGYVVVDMLGVIQELNARAALLMGTTRPQLKGRRFLLFVAPEERERFLQFSAAILADPDKQHALELALCCENGNFYHARVDGIAVQDPWGVKQCRFALTDISEQYRLTMELRVATAELADSELRFQTYFAQSSEAMVLLKNNSIVACNTAALALVGTQDENTLIGRHLAAYAPDYQPEGLSSRVLADEQLDRALRVGNATFQWFCCPGVGEDMVLHEVVLTPLSFKADALVHALIRDVTSATGPGS
jgi:PAS domain S-box-containing protein